MRRQGNHGDLLTAKSDKSLEMSLPWKSLFRSSNFAHRIRKSKNLYKPLAKKQKAETKQYAYQHSYNHTSYPPLGADKYSIGECTHRPQCIRRATLARRVQLSISGAEHVRSCRLRLHQGMCLQCTRRYQSMHPAVWGLHKFSSSPAVPGCRRMCMLSLKYIISSILC